MKTLLKIAFVIALITSLDAQEPYLKSTYGGIGTLALVTPTALPEIHGNSPSSRVTIHADGRVTYTDTLPESARFFWDEVSKLMPWYVMQPSGGMKVVVELTPDDVELLKAEAKRLTEQRVGPIPTGDSGVQITVTAPPPDQMIQTVVKRHLDSLRDNLSREDEQAIGQKLRTMSAAERAKLREQLGIKK